MSVPDIAQRLARSHGDKTEALFRDWHDTWLSPAFSGFDGPVSVATMDRDNDRKDEIVVAPAAGIKVPANLGFGESRSTRSCARCRTAVRRRRRRPSR